MEAVGPGNEGQTHYWSNGCHNDKVPPLATNCQFPLDLSPALVSGDSV